MVVIPDGVTAIGNGTFFNKAITAINLPASVRTIGNSAFMNTQITSINMPNVTSIDDYAFSGATLLTSVTIPVGVTVISEYAFAYTFALTSVTIPSNVTTIEAFAFTVSGITSIDIPATVSTIGEAAFSGASALTSITVAAGHTSYEASADGVLFNKPPTTLLAYPAGRVGSYVVPSGVTRIGIEAFGSSKVTSVSLPDSLVEIGTQAFNRTNQLTSLEIPQSVTALGMGVGVFDYALALSSITVSDANSSFSSIDGVLFNKLSTKLLVYPYGKTATSYTIPATVSVIGDRAFYSASSLTSVIIPSGVDTVQDLAFYCAYYVTSFYFLGSAPRNISDSSFVCLSPEAKAYVKNASVGSFTLSDGKWNGLTVEIGDPPSGNPPSNNPPSNNPPSNNPPSGNPPSGNPPADSTPPVDLVAQATAADLAARTVGTKKRFPAKSLAANVGIKTVSPKAKVTFSIAKSSKKVCSKSGSKIKTLKAGNCVVTFTVQEPKPKKGKKPKATKTVKTLVVQ
jgi:hypothetical protein